MQKIYDIAIIGGGPAGLTAAVYALRANKSVILFEKNAVGGQMNFTFDIKNFPSIKDITGMELSQNMYKNAADLGLELVLGEVFKIKKFKNNFTLTHTKGTTKALKIILSMGTTARTLGVTGEKELLGRGISFCATCDGGLYKNKEVAVIGGGDTAFEDIIYLSNIAKKVYLVHRSTNFRAQADLQGKVKHLVKTGIVEMIPDAVVTAIRGKSHVEGIEIYEQKTKKTRQLQVQGIFIAVGMSPQNELISGLVELTEKGYIKVDEHKRTSVEGIYAAGDVTDTTLRQIVTACSDGAIAATFASRQ